jgi:hypothetical protein
MEGVEQVEGVSASNLYSRAKIILVSLFKSAKDATQVDDKDNNQVMVKGYTTVETNSPFSRSGGRIKFTLMIQCK